MIMKTLILFCLLVCFATSSTIAGPTLANDPNIPDTIRVDSIVAWTNGHGIVPVSFYNDETLAGIELTITLDSPDVQVDSFSFVGGRLETVSVKGTLNHTNAVTIYCFPFSTELVIPTGDGLLGTIWLSWALTIPPQLVTIDTTTIIINDIEYASTFSDNNANQFAPQYQAGKINILQGTGCCTGIRGNIDNSIDEEPNVADLTFLVNYLFKGGPPPDCALESDMDGVGGLEANVADLTYIVNYLFKGGPAPVSCQ